MIRILCQLILQGQTRKLLPPASQNSQQICYFKVIRSARVSVIFFDTVAEVFLRCQAV